MTANALGIPGKRIYTLSDLPALEAQRSQQPAVSQGVSNRIVTLGSLQPQPNSSDAAIREMNTSIDSLGRNILTQLDNFDRNLTVRAESERQRLEAIGQGLNRIAEQQGVIALDQRNIIVQRNNAQTCNYILITLLVLAILAILGLLLL